MSDGLWAASPSTEIPDGAVVEELMRRSLESSSHSVQGFWLWQARMVQQRRQRDQQRRRSRSEAESSTTEDVADAPRNSAEAAAEQRAEGVRAYVSALLHATGYPYQSLSNPQEEEEEAEKLEVALLASAGEEAARGATDSSSAQAGLSNASASLPDEAPAKVARVDRTGEKTKAKAASKPKSALAKLVAKAKAQYHDLAGDASAVTVVPALKNPPFPEDLPGMHVARGSSSTVSAAARKRVQFADAPHSDREGGRVAGGGVEGESDDDGDFDVYLPGHATPGASAQQAGDDGASAVPGTDSADATAADDAVAAKHPSQMTRAEFLSQFKRAPRRGEIGQTAEDIAAAEGLGYVMSGSRSVASRMYVDRVQRQLHEHEATKLQQQFRKVEDERMDDQLVHGLADFVMRKKKDTVG